MPNHGENYTRAVDPTTGEEIGKLREECGHHCGVITVGGANQHEGHCNCPDCHNGAFVKE